MDMTRPATLFLILSLFLAGPAAADVLLVDSIQSTPAMQTPRAGSPMTSVREAYGSPQTEHPTVSTDGGPSQPPITRWDYSGFSVFFEHDRVIHSVVHRAGN